ncbi:hypothetical protein [Pseudomonas jessenii]|uniref:hypothetical protein n=1 Tax=Pseudomonas jessenii TaxID=77298 RepID=UPI0011141C42|nr:hypothetical protein [Pseudomonas jessenii]
MQQVTAAGDVFRFALDPMLNGAVTARMGGHAESARHRFDPLTGQLVETSSPAIQRRFEYSRSGKEKSREWISSEGRFGTATTRSLNGLPISFIDVNDVELLTSMTLRRGPWKYGRDRFWRSTPTVPRASC